jgi:hypothetical protein
MTEEDRKQRNEQKMMELYPTFQKSQFVRHRVRRAYRCSLTLDLRRVTQAQLNSRSSRPDMQANVRKKVGAATRR